MEDNLNFTAPDEKAMKKKEKSLMMAVAITFIVIVILAIIGFLTLNPPKDATQGQVDGTSVRVSGLMPGRVEKFFVAEGQQVHKGDTLAKIQSATVEAKLAQALAMKDAAEAQQRKADAGARKQVIDGAYQLWQQAKAALEIHEKTYRRLQSLYEQNVVSAQKRDEAKAAYDAAIAAEKAAHSQYDMAVEGAQREDRDAAAAMAAVAGGSLAEVESILADQYLIAPCDGEVTDIFPNEGELVSTGTPIMNVMKADDRYLVFNVRETELKNLVVGKTVTVTIPALDMKNVEAKVYFVKDMGEYAAWRSTKAYGDFDSRTFEVRLRPTKPVEGLRPGMTAIME